MLSPSSLEKGLGATPSEVKVHGKAAAKVVQPAGDELLTVHNTGVKKATIQAESREPESTVNALEDRGHAVVTANLISSGEASTRQTFIQLGDNIPKYRARRLSTGDIPGSTDTLGNIQTIGTASFPDLSSLRCNKPMRPLTIKSCVPPGDHKEESQTQRNQTGRTETGFGNYCCNCNCTKSLEPGYGMQVKSFGSKPLEAWDVCMYEIVFMAYAKIL